MQEILKTAIELIKFHTVAKEEGARKACLDYICNFFSGSKARVRRFISGDVHSALITLNDRPAAVCLNGHYDVVDAEPEQFSPRVEGGRLYGRGAADMKGSLAAMMTLMKELSASPPPPPLALMVGGDEEVGGDNGTGYILDQGFLCEFGLAGEPSGLRVANQAKGALRLELTARGKSGHAARPWEGDNAIINMFAAFPNIWEVFGDPGPEDWKTTMTPSIIRGGETINRIPDECSVRVDIRHLPHEFPEELLIKIKRAAPHIEIKELDRSVACYCDPFNPYVESLKKAGAAVLGQELSNMKKHAASDARHFYARRIPAIVFGPGGAGIHGKDEYAELGQLESFYKILSHWAGSL